MKPQDQLRKVMDQANKLRAKMPKMPKLGRDAGETLNTSAVAKGQASLRHPNAKLRRM